MLIFHVAFFKENIYLFFVISIILAPLLCVIILILQLNSLNELVRTLLSNIRSNGEKLTNFHLYNNWSFVWLIVLHFECNCTNRQINRGQWHLIRPHQIVWFYRCIIYSYMKYLISIALYLNIIFKNKTFLACMIWR